MLNARAIAVIAAALSCCSAAARAPEATPPALARPIALPEAQTVALLGVALGGLAAFGRKRRP